MHLDLRNRRSVPSRLLAEPGPNLQQLRDMLNIASRVPDHGGLVPWRFLRLAPAAREALGQLLAQRAIERDPNIDEAGVRKERLRFSHAPEVVVVIGCYQQAHRIPVIEQQHTSACVCFSLLQAAQATGFSAQWLTGWAAYDETVQHFLGVQPNEVIVGFIHIGSAKEELAERPRPTLDSLLQEFSA
ncbi:MAG: nitroreductase [Aquimonas sp.]|jgi:nitroreductase|nr:nitroreductase [Xanthomonadales bacterium]MCC6507248.1 nitroreductase [Aquimonas sp.]